jgi:alpha-tubulin suppressor-like RCC1 family protein
MPVRTTALGLLCFAALGGCEGPHALRWRFSFESEPLRARAVRIEATVLAGGCASSDVVYRAEIARDLSAMMPPTLEAGVYGLSGRARDRNCVWYASVCEEVTLPFEQESIELVLGSSLPMPACSPAECTDGICTGASDAGMLDAGGADACTPEACNELDDDCDGRTDEGFDLETDRLHCGRCNNECAPIEACVAGSCASGPIQVVTGGVATCVLMASGEVRCCGKNEHRILGPAVPVDTIRSAPMPVPGVSGAVELAMGGRQACVRHADRTVTCWGRNEYGEVGTGTTTTPVDPTEVGGLSGVVALGLGGFHSCALDATGAVFCWGNNTRGQLGDGTLTSSTLPRRVMGLDDAVEVQGAYLSTCARRKNGTLACWGAGHEGMGGDGMLADNRPTPVGVSMITNATGVSLAWYHNCALLDDGTISCWGDGTFGALGMADRMDRPAPSGLVRGLAGPATAVRGGSYANCALLDDGTVQCWGSGDHGALGNGRTLLDRAEESVTGLTDAVYLSEMDTNVTCVIRTGGRISCWGFNENGQVCDGTTMDRGTPTPMMGFE